MAIQQEGFEITASQMFRLGKLQAEEFLEVYKGVVNEYSVSIFLDCNMYINTFDSEHHFL